MMPCLSIVIPAYNAKATIRECLESILSGCKENIEVLVVDDGSSDGTGEEVLAVGSPLVRAYRQENAGVSVARNVGVRFTRGDYIMFVDADDRLSSTWFSIMAPHLNSHEDVVVFTETAEKERYQFGELVGAVVGRWPQAEKVALKWVTSPFSRIYSRSFLKKQGLEFDSRIINGEDALFNLQTFCSTENIKFINKSFYKYRIHSDSATHTFDSRFFASNENYLIKLKSILTDSGWYSTSEIDSFVDFSFCRSIEIMVLRAARVSDRAERKLAASEIVANPLVAGRMSRGANIEGNSQIERRIYRLVERGHAQFAIELLHMALTAKEKATQGKFERWVNI